MGKSFVHGQVIGAWSHYITFALAIQFIFMRKIMIAHWYAQTPATLLHAQTWAKVFFMRKLRSGSSTRWSHPQELYGWEQSSTLQAQAETANQLYYLQVLSKAI